jgi:hypothetical protein
MNLLFSIFAFLGSVIVTFQLYGFSADYLTYANVFPVYNSFNYLIWIEPSFIIASIFLSPIPYGFSIYLFLNTYASLFLKFSVAKSININYTPIILFYVLTIFMLHEYTQIRFSTALALFYYGYFCVTTKTNRFIWYILALSFHYAIIILLILLCFSFVKLTRTRVIISILIAVVACFAISDLFANLIETQARLQGYQAKQGSLYSLLSFGKFLLLAPYVVTLIMGNSLNSRLFKLHHLIVLATISVSYLPEVLSVRIAGMGYFTSLLLVSQLNISANGIKNILYFFTATFGFVFFLTSLT